MRKSRLLAGALIVVAFHSAGAMDFTVTNTNTSGAGSLAQAITDANKNAGADRIVFNLPGSGVQKIFAGVHPLPTITDTVMIDGYTQPGTHVNTSEQGSNAALLIQIDGSDYNGGPFNLGGGAVGLQAHAAGCTIRGLIITGFAAGHDIYGPTYGGDCINVNAANCVIEGNIIGPGAPAGVLVNASHVVVGGNTLAARNVIIGNEIGVRALSTAHRAANDVRIIGNQIGTDSGGPTPGKGNDAGIVFSGTTATTVGGTTPGDANLISGNRIGIATSYNYGIFESVPEGNGVLIEGNAIGLQPHSSHPAVNQEVGVQIYGGVNNTVGGLDRSAGNVIAYNHAGVAVIGTTATAPPGSGSALTISTGNRILSNLIYANSDMPIDLELAEPNGNGAPATGPTSNDFQDADTGPNNLQNFPVVTSVEPIPNAAPGAPNTTISGGLNSTPNTKFTIQLYHYDLQPQLLGTITVTTDASGDAPFSFSYEETSAPKSGSYYTATATDASGNTSEFMPQSGPVQMANISTRAFIGTGENILIGGFIINGPQSKRVCLRGLGPSLNVGNKLADPYLELYDNNGMLIAKNDDWRSGQQQEISDAGLAPSSDVESALIATLTPGKYTAHLFQMNGGTGNGIVEIYDLDPFPAATTRLANLSTRGVVGTNDDLLIGGTIVRGDAPQKICARAIGPDLAGHGVTGALQDPMLELRDSSGTLLASNDNWRENSGEAPPAALQPGDDRDAVITTTVAPGLYTAIVRGKNDSTGVALVELYDLTE